MNDVLETLRTPFLLGALVATGLQAGTYYAWASGVMPGLARVDDRTFVHTMQQVNVAIVNPVFLATFLGAPALGVLAAVAGPPSARTWLVAGAALAVATVVVTGAGNVPLNDSLEAAGAVDRIGDLAAVRADFESSWVRLNALRAATSTASLLALGWAAFRA
ncbi:DUF1772 domain-containing protein [Nocardioides sp. SYSU D00038]|uniref:anthrone oxygenase family protein n=1 Tax=Nocardioides sp. SYSU D00038 TaxID=2812554 RepID=UPI001966E4AB|nr:anthrone oxygenase family protein [Nocardioides sp. SYSU D00038]